MEESKEPGIFYALLVYLVYGVAVLSEFPLLQVLLEDVIVFTIRLNASIGYGAGQLICSSSDCLKGNALNVAESLQLGVILST